MRVLFLIVFFLLSGPTALAQSTDAAEPVRSIKSLSAERIAGLEAGHGLGYARAAERNGYPGPKHVLELADALALSDEQRIRTQALFDAMQARAIELGRALLAAEAELRALHLQAHLAQIDVLDDRQIAEYARLRGYAAQDHARHHGQDH